MDLSESNEQPRIGVSPSPPSLDARLAYQAREIIGIKDGLGLAFDNMSTRIQGLQDSASTTAAAVESLAAVVADLTTRSRVTPASRTNQPDDDIDDADPAGSRVYFACPAPLAAVPVDARLEPKFPCPKPFSGEFSMCRGFLGQCELFFRHQPARYAAEETRVALVVSLLAGRALQWAMATVANNSRLSTHYDEFLQEFQLVFDHPEDGRNAAARLHDLRQGTRTVADYTVEFRTLAAESGWDELALQSAYRRGLSDAIKDTIIQKKPPSLNALILLSLQVDERIQERKRERARNSTSQRTTAPKSSEVTYRWGPAEKPRDSSSVQTATDEEMDVTQRSKRLTRTQRDGRMAAHQCLYCGSGDHYVQSCPRRPKDRARQ